MTSKDGVYLDKNVDEGRTLMALMLTTTAATTLSIYRLDRFANVPYENLYSP